MTISLENKRNILYYFEGREDSTFKCKLCPKDNKPFILRSKESLKGAKTHFLKKHTEIWNAIKQKPEEKILNIRKAEKFKKVQKKTITENINQKWHAQNFSKIGANSRGTVKATNNENNTNELVSTQETINIEFLSNVNEISNNINEAPESDQETSTETLCNENESSNNNTEVHESDQEISNNNIEGFSINQNEISNNNKKTVIDNIKDIEATEENFDVNITNDKIIIKGKCKISFK
ncbi:975_t:CDS:1 [Cetraspora pellucida]|uniref:975_t:CDS:1 n=1 Tax=Cetraspora pellucida TaxID=1433469 RepID=A0ACA9L8Z4_9GLOM|nr:975_t:CDS:1 [Cetraspora pellucida]